MTLLACDMGGRRIKLGLVRDGTVIASEVIPACADRPLLERLESVAASLSDLCAANDIPVTSCGGIGMSYPSIIDAARDHAALLGCEWLLKEQLSTNP